MKKMHQKAMKMLLLMAVVFAFNACVKDTAWQHYTIYRPLYKTLAQVQSELKSSTPVAIAAPGKLFTIGNYIFLNEKNKGIHIIDNSNPATPVNKGFIPIPGNEDVAVHGNTLYADCYTNLFTIDITDPMQATLTKTTAGIFPDRNLVNGFGIDSDHIIYDWMAKDTSVKIDLPDFQSLNKSTFVARADGAQNFSVQSSSAGTKTTGQGGSMARFAIVNDYLYTVTNSSLNVLNLAQPQQPQFQNRVSLGFGIETIYPFQDKLFIGSTTGMIIYSVANAAQPVRLGGFAHARLCDPVITDGQYAYITLRSGGGMCGGIANQLDVVNVQNLTSPSLVKTYPMTNPRGLGKDGQWLFICDGKAGLKCYDATTANNVVLKKTIPMAETYDVICGNNLAIVSAADGLYQYDYSDINNIKLLSTTAWRK